MRGTIEITQTFISEYVEPTRPKLLKTDMELKLNIKDEKPFHFNPRQLSISERKNLRRILDELLAKEIIQPSKSEYASPIVLVRKKNG